MIPGNGFVSLQIHICLARIPKITFTKKQMGNDSTYKLDDKNWICKQKNIPRRSRINAPGDHHDAIMSGCMRHPLLYDKKCSRQDLVFYQHLLFPPGLIY